MAGSKTTFFLLLSARSPPPVGWKKTTTTTTTTTDGDVDGITIITNRTHYYWIQIRAARTYTKLMKLHARFYYSSVAHSYAPTVTNGNRQRRSARVCVCFGRGGRGYGDRDVGPGNASASMVNQQLQLGTGNCSAVNAESGGSVRGCVQSYIVLHCALVRDFPKI